MRKRNIQKIVRFNRKEAQDLAAKAKKACLSEAGLIRLLIRGYEPKEKPDDRLRKKAGKISIHRRNCSVADMLRILWRVSS